MAGVSMNSCHFVRRGASFLAVVFAATLAHAQGADCGRNDSACLLAEFESVCRTPPISSAVTCAAWLETLEAHEFSAEPQWQLIAGSAHRTLARMSDDPVAAAESVEASRASYLSVLDETQIGAVAADAYLGLSLIAGDPEERLVHLRRAVEADPANGMYAEFLARVIYADGDVGLAGGADGRCFR